MLIQSENFALKEGILKMSFFNFMNPREMIRSHAYPVLAGIGAVSLVVIAASLAPIAKWSRIQVECIERTYRVDGNNVQGIPHKVWSCNGGGQ